MLDAFLAVAYDQDTRHTESVKLAKALKDLPMEDLKKLASGEAKLAFADCVDGPEDKTWIGKYKGTPLFEQALALEKAELEAEVAQSQMRAQERASDQLYQTKDQIRLQKKMLDLDLVAQQGGQASGVQQPMAVLPNGEAQGTGAPGDAGPDAEPQKLSFAVTEKAAANFASAALQLAKANPKAIGAGIGAVGGAIAGGPDHRLSGALGGAAVGASAGHAAHGIGMRMTGPGAKGFAEAAQGYGKSLANQARGALTPAANPSQYAVTPKKPPLPAGAPAQAHTNRALDALDATRGKVAANFAAALNQLEG